MKSGARVALAVGFGYLLGRRKKMRTALTLAAAVAAGRASQRPGGLKQLGTDLLNVPQLGGLGKLGAPLATAGKAAATAAAGSGIDALSGKLRGSADALRRKSGGGPPEEEAAGGQRSAADDEEELDEQPTAEDETDRGGRPVVARRQRGR
ncbi:hypothetical protein ACFFMM_14960 [Micromonospora chaiyaphumensis]|uniref:Uncharacterized protein n=1 Tax=Micromonospora chaiyaphumensis TaxID=307119 RepID=A0A1C4YIN4_9ACTN|nr:hypothetical protein [Micromonospora chaiyaphumensis]SCF20201.1 hypothetical protein GA0070214_108230 [Micromonospora chaiyaphumensis]